MIPALKLLPKRVILFIVITVLTFLVGAFAGYTFCKRANYKGVINQQANDAEEVMKHQERKDVIDTEVKKHIDAVKQVPDTGGCLDKRSPDAYLDKLLDADSISQSGFN